MSWLKKIRDWTGIRRVKQLFRSSEDREQLANVIADGGPNMALQQEEEDIWKNDWNKRG